MKITYATWFMVHMYVAVRLIITVILGVIVILKLAIIVWYHQLIPTPKAMQKPIVRSLLYIRTEDIIIYSPLQETKDESLEGTLEYFQHVQVCHVVKKSHGTTPPDNTIKYIYTWMYVLCLLYYRYIFRLFTSWFGFFDIYICNTSGGKTN